jgi:hypothetical protein
MQWEVLGGHWQTLAQCRATSYLSERISKRLGTGCVEITETTRKLHLSSSARPKMEHRRPPGAEVDFGDEATIDLTPNSKARANVET